MSLLFSRGNVERGDRKVKIVFKDGGHETYRITKFVDSKGFFHLRLKDTRKEISVNKDCVRCFEDYIEGDFDDE
jgi:hypothetical protein